MQIKPIILTDLDDTLFQTKRKIEINGYSEAFEMAAFDREMQPRSFFTEKQSIFTKWLLDTTILIPVTARGTEEFSRVKIPFNSFKITTHGAVILDENNQPLATWKELITEALKPVQSILQEKQKLLSDKFKHHKINAWARINTEYDNTNIYLVAKHKDSSQIKELYDLCDEIDKETGLDGFYIHRNDNNIAWLPKSIEKSNATRFLISLLEQTYPNSPIIGFGDSISDYSFLQLCDWYGTPNKGQLHNKLSSNMAHTSN